MYIQLLLQRVRRLIFTFGYLNQIYTNTDKNNSGCLRPAKTVLPQSQRSNRRNNQNQITVYRHNCRFQIFQTDRKQHIADRCWKYKYKHQNQERCPMERHRKHRCIESSNKCNYNSRDCRTGKCISQHGHRPDGRKDTLAKYQINCINDRTDQTKHIPHESIGCQIITLLCQDTDQRTDQTDRNPENLLPCRFLFLKEENKQKYPDRLKTGKNGTGHRSCFTQSGQIKKHKAIQSECSQQEKQPFIFSR